MSERFTIVFSSKASLASSLSGEKGKFTNVFGTTDARGRKEKVAALFKEHKDDPTFGIITYGVNDMTSSHDSRMLVINSLAEMGMSVRRYCAINDKVRIEEALVFLDNTAHREYIRWVVNDKTNNPYADLIKARLGVEKVNFVKNTSSMFDVGLRLKYSAINRRRVKLAPDAIAHIERTLSKMTPDKVAAIISDIDAGKVCITIEVEKDHTFYNLIPEEIEKCVKEKPYYSHQSGADGFIALKMPHRVVERIVVSDFKTASSSKYEEFIALFKKHISEFKTRYALADKRAGFEVFCDEPYREFINRRSFSMEHDLGLLPRGISVLDNPDKYPDYIWHSFSIGDAKLKLMAYLCST
jgi:hypothetical protein